MQKSAAGDRWKRATVSASKNQDKDKDKGKEQEKERTESLYEEPVKPTGHIMLSYNWWGV